MSLVERFMTESITRTFRKAGGVSPHALVGGECGALACLPMECRTEEEKDGFAATVAMVASEMPGLAFVAIVAEGWKQKATCAVCIDPRRCRHSTEEVAKAASTGALSVMLVRTEVVSCALFRADGHASVLTAEITRTPGSVSLGEWVREEGDVDGRFAGVASASFPTNPLEVN